MPEFVSRQRIFYQNHKLSRRGTPIFNAGKVVSIKGEEVFIRLDYRVSSCLNKPKVFWTNPKYKESSWLRKPKIEHLEGNLFFSEKEMHAAIESAFGVTFEEIAGDSEKNVEFSLPTLPRCASLETIIEIIERSTVRYCTGVLLSNEAIVMAIANKPENAHLIVQLEQAKKYFRGIPALEVAA